MKLTLTTNSLVSPADLEPASDFEYDHNYKPALSTKPVNTNPIMVYQELQPQCKTNSLNSSNNEYDKESWPLMH